MSQTFQVALALAASAHNQVQAQSQNPTKCNGGAAPAVITIPNTQNNPARQCCTCDNTACLDDTYAVNTATPTTCCNKRLNAASYTSDCSITCGGSFPRLAADEESCVAADGCGASERPSTDGTKCCIPGSSDPADAVYGGTCTAECGGNKLLVAAVPNFAPAKCVDSCEAGQKASQDNKRCCLTSSTDPTDTEYNSQCVAVCGGSKPLFVAATTDPEAPAKCVATCDGGQKASQDNTRCCVTKPTDPTDTEYDSQCAAVCGGSKPFFVAATTDPEAPAKCVATCDGGQKASQDNKRCCPTSPTDPTDTEYNSECVAVCGGSKPFFVAATTSPVAPAKCVDSCDGGQKVSQDNKRCCVPKSSDPVNAEYDSQCTTVCGGSQLLVAATTSPAAPAKCVDSCEAGQKASQDNKRCCLTSSTPITNAEFAIIDNVCIAVCPASKPVRLDGTATQCTSCARGELPIQPSSGGIPDRCCKDDVNNAASYGDNCFPVCRESLPLLSINLGGSMNCVTTCSNSHTLTGTTRCCANIPNGATYKEADCTAVSCARNYAIVSAETADAKCCAEATGATSYEKDCTPVCPTAAGSNNLLQLDGKSCKTTCEGGGVVNTANTKCCTAVPGAASYDSKCGPVCPTSGSTFLAGDGKSCKAACDSAPPNYEETVGTRCCTRQENVETYNSDCTAKTCSAKSNSTTPQGGRCPTASFKGSASSAFGHSSAVLAAAAFLFGSALNIVA